MGVVLSALGLAGTIAVGVLDVVLSEGQARCGRARPRPSNERRCPYCRETLDAGGELDVSCAACATEHHADCFSEHGGCSVHGCGPARARERIDRGG